MAKASTHAPTDLVKTIYIGSSGTGKTGSLVSLIKAGYFLRVLDMDNGIGPLVHEIKRQCPELLDNLDYISLRDKLKSDPLKGAAVAGAPKAYTSAIKYMDKWDDGSTPSEWGNNTIFVLDSLTLFGRAAYRWAQGMNPTSKDPRQWYGAAQESITTVLDLLTGAEFKSHVIVVSHIDLIELSDGSTKGFPSAIGKALGPKLATVFNNLIAAESRGTGESVKRSIITMPTALLDLKNENPHVIKKQLDLNTGMAEIFEKLRK